MNDTLIVPLPTEITSVLGHFVDHDGFLTGVHPGLTLDKFVLSWDPNLSKQSHIRGGADVDSSNLSKRVQRPAVEQVVRLSKSPPMSKAEYQSLYQRWANTIGVGGFIGTTAGPFTLHLARASALENAGICFHRVYGFVYLPGSGLKGLARAFAETVWLESQSNRQEAWRQIEQVFGWAPGSNKDKAHLPNNAEHHRKDIPASAGNIIFHDAWPKTWPELVVDILNSHHANYYQGKEPPGDWEDPIPVYFLSVKPQTPFHFTVASRRNDTPSELVTLAREWLIGGLTQLGAGAKTASGYGDFTVDEPERKPIVTKSRPTFEATLELVTPAFLAGAKQEAADCDLRPSTLRGQLRWWWRTMHAGFVTIDELRKMEAAIWGDTNTGGAVRVTVRPIGPVQPIKFDRKALIGEQRLPAPPDKKTTQGLTYHSYGMDEQKNGQQVTRCYLANGTKWSVTIRSSGPLADLKLAQARGALSLLCRFGGVGAKSRNGFGSFADLPDFSLESIKRDAIAYRTASLGRPTNSSEANAQSPSLEQMLTIADVPSGGQNPWNALDQLAASAQQFAKRYKHQLPKRALGLPRKIGSPTSGMFRPGRHVKDRHASPVMYHFSKDHSGNLIARVTAFPACELPNLNDSRTLLMELLNHLTIDLPPRFKTHVAGKKAIAASRGAIAGPELKNGQRVKAKIVKDPKDKGRPFAEIEGLVGNILNVPTGTTLELGMEVELIINSVNVSGKQIAFRWPG